jgi:hypothetical protein
MQQIWTGEGILKHMYCQCQALSGHGMNIFTLVERKRKCNSETGRGGPLCCELLRIPHYLDSRLKDSGKVASPTHRSRPTAQKHYFSASGSHFSHLLACSKVF